MSELLLKNIKYEPPQTKTPMLSSATLQTENNNKRSAIGKLRYMFKLQHLSMLLAMGLLPLFFGCNSSHSGDKNSEVTALQQPMTKPVENIAATKEQKERRAKSEEYCKSRNVPVYQNPNSLFVDSDEQVGIRTQEEVVDRALALCYIGLKSEGLGKDDLDQMDKDYGISAKLSPKERDYATAEQPTEQQKVDANWRYEGLHVLLWALGYIDTLSYPDKMCDVASDVKIIYELKEKDFRKKAKLRSKREILDQADLILRLHWACVSARLDDKQAPSGLDDGVVFERHHTLNWLINYLNQEWDDVTTDT
ncbi:DUF4272 domain-containing protein [Chryseolinea sp. T2]|uniref:DUF4272 domain-containing protein n=1 Tax=Chryseolinea sp. T2 TaxID=3129255 RepID=UPI003076F267